MSYVRNWLHCVWGTKNRLPFMIPEKKYEIITHIRVNAGIKGIYIDFLNGHSEHLHCLLLLDSDQMLSRVIQMIKGESSCWINRRKLIQGTFEWDDEYYGSSVSQAHIHKVRDYIKNQEEHHKVKTWEEECEEFISEYNFSKYKG